MTWVLFYFQRGAFVLGIAGLGVALVNVRIQVRLIFLKLSPNQANLCEAGTRFGENGRGKCLAHTFLSFPYGLEPSAEDGVCVRGSFPTRSAVVRGPPDFN